MEPEGMVHALEEIHRLLRPTGTLIEIHPAREVPVVEVRSGGEVTFAEPDPGYDYDDDLRLAEDAVATIVGRGRFVIDGRRSFEFLTHAASDVELRDHFAVTGGYDPDAKDEARVRLRDDLYARASEVLARSPGPAEIVYREPAQMSRLTPL